MIIVIAATPRCERISIFSGINGGVGRPSLSSSRLSRDYFRIVFRAFTGSKAIRIERSEWQSVKRRFVLQKRRGKFHFRKWMGEEKDARRTSGRGNWRILPRNRAAVFRPSLVLSADEPREFNRRTSSLQQKKTIFSVHLQRCTRSCLQWFSTSFAGRRERSGFQTT